MLYVKSQIESVCLAGYVYRRIRMNHKINPNIHELFSLAGKVAVVTGASGWLGSMMSQALAEAGAKVALADQNTENINNLADKFRENGLDGIGFVADLMREDSIAKTMKSIYEQCGRIDILVNSAHAPCVQKEYEDLSLEEIEAGYRNAAACVIAAKHAGVYMRKVGGGSIINISSKAGVVTGNPKLSEGLPPYLPITYEAEKAALIHMTRHMAVRSAKDDIRVNCISPGAFPGDHVKKQCFELIKRFSDQTPMGRVGELWELKGIVVFLASQASSFITGQNILVDGGWTIW
jgi:NAD(P)-dependent dehydrogenase (short-subunit alcohol dehydrogenase family)